VVSKVMAVYVADTVPNCDWYEKRIAQLTTYLHLL